MIEQREHSEIDFAVAVITGGIDQAADPASRDQDIAAPHIAVQKRRRRARRQPVWKVCGERFDATRERGGQMRKMHQQAPFGPEARPIVGPAIGNRQRAESVILGPAVAFALGEMQRGEHGSQTGPCAGQRAAVREKLKHQRLVAHAEHGRGGRTACGDGSQHLCFGSWRGAVLHDRLASVVQRDPHDLRQASARERLGSLKDAAEQRRTSLGKRVHVFAIRRARACAPTVMSAQAFSKSDSSP